MILTLSLESAINWPPASGTLRDSDAAVTISESPRSSIESTTSGPLTVRGLRFVEATRKGASAVLWRREPIATSGGNPGPGDFSANP